MTFALSHVKVDANGSAEYIPGAFFRLPIELCSRQCIQQYTKIKSAGWARSEFGYWAFSFQDYENFVVVPGLNITDLTPPRKKIFGYKAQFSKADVSSTGSSFRLAHGPNILDIVSYTLVENAIKYSPYGGNVEINIEDKDEKTVVSVTSTGPEVTDDEAELIFERGRRGSAAMSIRPSGTGLGLAVAREIVEIFGGSIYVIRGKITRSGDSIGMGRISFVFEIPTAGEDFRRKSAVDRMRGRRRR